LYLFCALLSNQDKETEKLAPSQSLEMGLEGKDRSEQDRLFGETVAELKVMNFLWRSLNSGWFKRQHQQRVRSS
jgi:hypothetical protein